MVLISGNTYRRPWMTLMYFVSIGAYETTSHLCHSKECHVELSYPNAWGVLWWALSGLQIPKTYLATPGLGYLAKKAMVVPQFTAAKKTTKLCPAMIRLHFLIAGERWPTSVPDDIEKPIVGHLLQHIHPSTQFFNYHCDWEIGTLPVASLVPLLINKFGNIRYPAPKLSKKPTNHQLCSDHPLSRCLQRGCPGDCIAGAPKWRVLLHDSGLDWEIKPAILTGLRYLADSPIANYKKSKMDPKEYLCHEYLLRNNFPWISATEPWLFWTGVLFEELWTFLKPR